MRASQIFYVSLSLHLVWHPGPIRLCLWIIWTCLVCHLRSFVTVAAYWYRSRTLSTHLDNCSVLSGGPLLYKNTMSSLLYITLSPVLGQRPQRTSSNESMWPTTWPYSRGTFPASSLKISPDCATRQILPALLKSRPCYVYLTHLTTHYNTRDCIHAISITSPPKLFTCKFVFSSCISSPSPKLSEWHNPLFGRTYRSSIPVLIIYSQEANRSGPPQMLYHGNHCLRESS